VNDEPDRQEEAVANELPAAETTDVLARQFVAIVRSTMHATGVGRTELARRMGLSRAYITQLITHPRSVTLRTMARFADALGIELSLSIRGYHPDEESVQEARTKASAEDAARRIKEDEAGE
jgi:transcriptional regulator with XRE-family HTH domain